MDYRNCFKTTSHKPWVSINIPLYLLFMKTNSPWNHTVIRLNNNGKIIYKNYYNVNESMKWVYKWLWLLLQMIMNIMKTQHKCMAAFLKQKTREGSSDHSLCKMKDLRPAKSNHFSSLLIFIFIYCMSQTWYLLLIAVMLVTRTYCDVWMIQNGTMIER